MADTDKKQVNVDFTKYPELYDALESLVEDLDTDRSKLIRQLVREKVDEHVHLNKVKKAVQSKVKQVSR